MKHFIFRYGTALTIGVTCNRGRKHQSDSVHGIGLCAVAMILGTSSSEEFHTVIRSLWTKHLSSIEINHKLIEVYDDGIMRVQHVSNWCMELGNGSWDIRHDDDCSGQQADQGRVWTEQSGGTGFGKAASDTWKVADYTIISTNGCSWMVLNTGSPVLF
jgi:hypothetical protein